MSVTQRTMKVHAALVALYLSAVLAEEPAKIDRKTLEHYDRRTEDAWRQQFERELKRSGWKPSPAEKEKAFRKYLEAKKRKNQEVQEMVDKKAAKRRELVLSGRVIDQDAKPVADATITFETTVDKIIGLVWKRRYLKLQKLTVRTDAAGRFTINAGKVDNFELKNIAAPGYLFFLKHQPIWEFVNINPAYKVGDSYEQNLAVKGDVTFRMWRIVGKPEKLVVAESNRFGVPKGGVRYAYSLFKPRGKKLVVKVEAGKRPQMCDLLFSVHEYPNKGRVVLRVEGIDGGITDKGVPGFIAPAQGYQQAYDIDLSKGPVTKLIFTCTRGGRVYARGLIDTRYYREANKGIAGIRFSYSCNPTGSRNLQPGGGEYRSWVDYRKLDEETWAAAQKAAGGLP